jgi:3-hydroxyisobutyrate dehydrogenase-like beta-hydroxyacid dehydrogenase
MPIVDQNNRTKRAGGTLGFIGLGYRGSRIAKRLLDAGYGLVVFNRNHAKAEAFASQGAEMAASPGELASRADIILSCLADGRAVRSVYSSAGGVLDYTRPGSVIVEMSTIASEASTQLSEG